MRLAAKTDANVYIWGNRLRKGTCREGHSSGERTEKRPFIAVNCGAIPESLMESELFGYAEGAFTGAKRRGSKGKFEQAHRGTIFLDEIGEIPYQMQVALLRIIEERKVTPIGGTREVPLDIRIITATHRDLKDLLQKGKIREDLYYRLHVYPVKYRRSESAKRTYLICSATINNNTSGRPSFRRIFQAASGISLAW